MASDVTISSAIQQQQGTSAAGTQLAEDFNQFLTLLTVQLQNQDPLSPMDTTEFTNQIVSFTGVEQQINTNQKLDALVAMGLTNAFTGALQYVGLDISYLSSEFHYDGAKPVDVSYALDEQAAETKVSIFDASGGLVFRADVSSNVGVNNFTWDGSLTNGGTAPAGTYEIKVDALDIEGNAISSSTVVTGAVKGVETQNGTIFLLVGDRAVPVGSVLNASKPPIIVVEDEGGGEEDPPATPPAA
ncbi:MAG: basal-body rod modification protein FlgD [Micavibrio sp.]|nr:MAG: basal-body rod modification protein FlgD [Micavibrio sp.]